MNIKNYAKQTAQEIADLVERDKTDPVEAFTDFATQRLIQAGELQGCVASTYSGKDGSLNGWAFEDDEQTLHLVVTDLRDSEAADLTTAQITFAFKSLSSFVDSALKGKAASGSDGPVADAAETIRERWGGLQGANLYLVTNAVAKQQVPKSVVHIDGVGVGRHVWDLGRLFRLDSSGVDREPITVSLEEVFGAPIPCIAGPEAQDHTVYLALFPGEALAAIYNQHGPRLLERNVRSFLQARGAVNKGIRETILEEPGRFLAYNNGISATASDVDLVQGDDGGLAIATLHDFQIVNGGQTTASIATAVKKDHADVSGIAVQAKITVVEPTVIDELVRHISQYSNTQNKVTGADFSANDKFHQAIERFAGELRTPSDAPNADTCWFYERARGQYVDEAARKRNAAERKRFRELFPPSQRFTKTDLAKFEHSWNQLPHFVSLGAEKNFREFTLRLAEKPFTPNEAYFRRLVAKAILFRRAEEIISDLGFGGFRANIVTFTVAKLSHTTMQRLDLESIWKKQELSGALESAIRELAPDINDAIRNPQGRVANPTEWAKKKELWEIIRGLEWKLPTALNEELIPLRSEGEVDQLVVDVEVGGLSGAEAKLIAEIAEVPADFWYRLSNWAKETGNLHPWQRSLAYSLGGLATKKKPPTIKQATQGSKILETARSLGFR